MENIKTLGELLQEVVENDDDKWYSLHEFLLEAEKEDLKRIEKKLTEADQKQFYECMDAYTFVNEDEVYMAVCEYYEKTMNRPLCMGECGDMSEIAEDYMRDRGLEFEEICEECGMVHSEENDKNTTKEEIILPFQPNTTMENQLFFGDLYGYKNYNGKELTEDFISNGDYIRFWDDGEEINVDCEIDERGGLKEIMEYYEKEGTLITEIFLKQRVMYGTPLFEHLKKGGKVKLVMI